MKIWKGKAFDGKRITHKQQNQFEQYLKSKQPTKKIPTELPQQTSLLHSQSSKKGFDWSMKSKHQNGWIPKLKLKNLTYQMMNDQKWKKLVITGVKNKQPK